MALIVPPMLPEDRKHLDVPPMPAPGMRFRDGGRIWQLVGVRSDVIPEKSPRLFLKFAAIDPAIIVNPV